MFYTQSIVSSPCFILTTLEIIRFPCDRKIAGERINIEEIKKDIYSKWQTKDSSWEFSKYPVEKVQLKRVQSIIVIDKTNLGVQLHVYYYGQFSLSLGNALTFSLNPTCLIRTPINVGNRHLFLAQSTNSHRKPTSLMRTLHYQWCAEIDLSILKVKKPSVDSILMLPALPYTWPVPDSQIMGKTRKWKVRDTGHLKFHR